MESPTFKRRFLSFIYSLGTYLGVGILAFILSPETVEATLGFVNQHFGNTYVATVVTLLLPEIVKELRNQFLTQGTFGAKKNDVTLI